MRKATPGPGCTAARLTACTDFERKPVCSQLMQGAVGGQGMIAVVQQETEASVGVCFVRNSVQACFLSGSLPGSVDAVTPTLYTGQKYVATMIQALDRSIF